MHNRQNALHQWLQTILPSKPFTLIPLTGDASFRRYFRLEQDEKKWVVMDAPPDKEPLEPFVNAANLLQSAGLRTPFIHAINMEEGFAILEDFGDMLLLNQLTKETVDEYYKAAMSILIRLQDYSSKTRAPLPSFDNGWALKELNLFNEWFLGAYLQVELSHKEQQLIAETFAWLSNEINQQAQVIIHRDYHSRNIMVLNDGLGIIDFQDAMYGPFTYDLVSLLKDCYVKWPREQILHWLSYFYHQSALCQQYSLNDYIRAFDYCGLQRHFKVLGIFSRLALRDNKPNYLNDLPLTLHYVMVCLESYSELKPFYSFMQERICLP